jgi:ADP-heptose:LPS heptosyltransferase
LTRRFAAIDLLLHADYPGVEALFRDWSGLRSVYDGRTCSLPCAQYDIVVPAVPPFYWARFCRLYQWRSNLVARPPDAMFYRNEQSYYLDFARRLGCDVEPAPYPFLPVSEPTCDLGVDGSTLVIAPGCKTGEMAAKRWPYYPALAEMFEDVVLVGTPDDLRHFDGSEMVFPRHVRSLIGCLSLTELAAVLGSCGVVVANDSGIGHLATAVGVPTILIFGPTPDRTLGQLAPNVAVLRAGMACEPCWFDGRFAACSGGLTCLRRLSVKKVADCVRSSLARSTNDGGGPGSACLQ